MRKLFHVMKYEIEEHPKMTVNGQKSGKYSVIGCVVFP
jgi:hypothetical protein